MDRDAVLADLVNLSPQAFVSRYIFDRCPVVFNDRDKFVEWKNKLSEGIEVDAASITLIGSSAIGLSLNPNKSFKAFDAMSDVDVAVVSSFHFQTAWRYLRNNGHIRYRLGPKQKAAWDDHVNRLIFWGAVGTDKLLPLMPFATSWLKAATDASNAAAIADRDVKFRIYADYESLRAYQIRSIKTARDLALTGS